VARNKMRTYLDVAQTWPDLTEEEREKIEKEIEEENKNLKEWPKM
jgi:hypothetical protein